MAGPEEKRLAKAQSASPEAIRTSADSWRAAADGLAEVSEALRNAKVRIRESWSGPSAEDAEAAFDSLASSVDRHQETMRHAVRSLDTAAGGLDQAKQEYTSLPPVLPMPTAPDLTGQTDRQSVETEMRYIRLVSAHRQSADARETKAATANAALERDLAEASQEMGLVTPKPTDDRFGRAGVGDGARGGGAGPRSTTQDGHSGGEPLSSPYASGSGGTYVSAIGGVAGAGLAAAGGRSSGPGTLGSGVRADGPVDGAVGGGASVAGAVGSAGGSGAEAGTSTGGAVGGAVGAAGGAAGLRGALGGLKAGPAAPSGAPAQLGRTAGGRLGTSGVIGSSSTAGTSNGARGALGSPTRGSSVAGAPGTSGAAGQTARPVSGSPAAGARGGTSVAAGRPGGSVSNASTPGRAAPGGAGASGMRAGGRGGAGAGVAGAAGRSAADDQDERSSITFEDDVWLDDEETGPGVLG